MNLEVAEGLEIMWTASFKNLGFTISSNTTTKEEINSRLLQTRSINLLDVIYFSSSGNHVIVGDPGRTRKTPQAGVQRTNT